MKRYIATCLPIKDHNAIIGSSPTEKKALEDALPEGDPIRHEEFTVYEIRIVPIKRFVYKTILQEKKK